MFGWPYTFGHVVFFSFISAVQCLCTKHPLIKLLKWGRCDKVMIKPVASDSSAVGDPCNCCSNKCQGLIKWTVIKWKSICICCRLLDKLCGSDPSDRSLHLGQMAELQHIKMRIWPLALHRIDGSCGVIRMWPIMRLLMQWSSQKTKDL